MIHAVADQVDQRIVQLVDHGLVQLRVGPLDGELDLFVQLDGQVVNQAAKPLEGGAQRQHADTHGVLPQLGGQAFDGPGDLEDVGIVPAEGGLVQARLDSHQLPHQVDQLVQLVGRHPDARRGARP